MVHLYLATVGLSLAAVLLSESWFPLHPAPQPPLGRWLRNLSISALALAVTLATPMLFWQFTRAWASASAGGAMPLLGLPAWAQWVLTFLLLDGLAYAIHRLSHHVHWLWRLHAIHHSDPELDATTTHRHHPLENLVTAVLSLALLTVLQPPPLAALAYTLTAVVVSTLSHGNLRLPDALDRLLRPLVVTPAYHRAHHSAVQSQTDSNYATVLPLFDHLFRTASRPVDDGGRHLTIGLENGSFANRHSVAGLLTAPFVDRSAASPAGTRATPRSR